MKDLLNLDTMLTPKIITFVYWFLLVAAVISGLGAMFSGGLSFGGLIAGILVTIGGLVAARVWCELLIVLFKMNDALQEMRSK